MTQLQSHKNNAQENHLAKRVLQLLSQKPLWTGSGIALDALVRNAARAGWEQCVVCGLSPEDPAPQVGDLPADRIHPLVFGRDALPFTLPGMSDVMPYPSSRFSELTDDEIAAYCDAWRTHIAQVVREFQPDVIHSHHIWLMSSLVKDVAPNTPVVTHSHGTGLRQLTLSPRARSQVKAGCARNDAFLLLHHGQQETVREELGVPDEKLFVIGNGFREEVFHSRGRLPSPGPVVTYAGKLSDAKGVPWLLDAANRLAGQIPGFRLHIAGAGAGPEAEAIRTRMKAANHVTFHGQLTAEKLADLLRQSATFVLPSFFEGLPLVLVEAAACGCRLVATALPGVVNQLQPALGDQLDLVPLPRLRNLDQPVEEDLPQFVDQLTTALAASLSKPQLETGEHQVAQFTWSAIFREVETIWWDLIDGES
ncbi:MAG: glycosyltransferase [Planctomycetaceae bacterium]